MLGPSNAEIHIGITMDQKRRCFNGRQRGLNGGEPYPAVKNIKIFLNAPATLRQRSSGVTGPVSHVTVASVIQCCFLPHLSILVETTYFTSI